MNTKDINFNKLFFLFLAAHVICWTLAAWVFQKNGPLDVMEALAWGRHWQWGYDRDPYLIAWVSHIVSFGGRSLWSIYLFSQLCVATTFWAIWRLAHKMGLSSAYAFVAVLLLEGVVYFNFSTPEFNDNVLQLPLWALSTLCFYSAIKKQRLVDWIAVGGWLGLAFMSKYFTLWLMISMCFFLLINERGRESFRRFGIYCSGVVFLVIVIPNFIWLWQHDFLYVNYALGRARAADNLLSHVWYPVRFAVEQVCAIFPALVLFWVFCFTTPHPNLSSQGEKGFEERFNKAFLFSLGLGPFVAVAVYAAITGTQLRSMWGTPLFNLLGLMLVFLYGPSFSLAAMQRFIISVGIFFVLTLGAYGFSIAGAPYWTGKGKTALFPSKKIASLLTEKWHQQYHQPLKYVVGSRRLVARLSFYSPDHPIPYFEGDVIVSPWVNENDLKKSGGLFIYQADENEIIPIVLKKRFPQLQERGLETFQWQTFAKVKPVKILVAYLPPVK